MFNTKYNIFKNKNTKVWDELVNNSPQGCIFNQIEYLDIIGEKYHLWLIEQGEEIKAGICLVVSEDEKKIIHSDFVIYSGIIFNDLKNTKISKKRHQEFQITEFVVKEISKKYETINFSLSPFIYDIRAFQWFNFGVKNKRKFSIGIKYTSILDISEFNDENFVEDKSKLFLNLDPVRRYSIREARKEGAEVLQTNSNKLLIDFYSKMMTKKNFKPNKKKMNSLAKISSLCIQKRKGAIFEILNKKKNILYTAFYVWDNNMAYYLFGAGGNVTTSWQSSLIHWEVFKFLAYEKKITRVDLEGVNSPKRGWFKLTFGGSLKTYFNISY